MKKKLIDQLKESGWKINIIPYFLYALGCIFIYHLIISLVVFFHFLLGHNFSTIDQWTLSNGWELLILSKLISLMVFIIFINSYTSPSRSLSRFVSFISFKWEFNRTFWVAMVYLFLSTIFFLKPSLDMNALRTFDLYSFLMSFFGATFFFLTDFIALALLFYFFPTAKNSLDILRLIILNLILIMECKFLSPYGNGNGLVFIMHSVILFLIFYIDAYKLQWNICFYLLFIVFPMNNFWGLNFVFGSFYAPFPLENFSYSSLLLLWSIAYFYLYIRLVKSEVFWQKYLSLKAKFTLIKSK